MILNEKNEDFKLIIEIICHHNIIEIRYHLYTMLLGLAKKYGTDKHSHNYIPHYERIFEPLKDKRLNILEIGVREGWSHLMWSEYFKNSNIYGIDNFSDPRFEKNSIEKKYDFERIVVFIGNQTDEKFLNDSIDFSPDIIIDDGGHMMSHQQLSLKYLFRKLNPGGYYIIEDLHTSNSIGFLDVPNRDKKFSTLNFLRNIRNKNVDSHFIKGDDLIYIQDNIEGIDIYNNKICIIRKKHISPMSAADILSAKSNGTLYCSRTQLRQRRGPAQEENRRTAPHAIYVRGTGGLGNCLFQIATAIYYKEKYGGNIYLDSNNRSLFYGTSNVHGRRKNLVIKGKDVTYRESIFKHLSYREVSGGCEIVENNHTANKIVPRKDILIKGWCQNLGLFQDYLHKIPEYLDLTDAAITNYIRNKYSNIETGVMIGLRVGNDFRHMTGIDRGSYINALEALKSAGVDIGNLFIVSDVDDAWDRHFDLQNEYPATVVNEDDITQVYFGLMCQHYILSESTFHLWIAYLGTINREDKKVIVFNKTDVTKKSLSLKNWIKIDC